MLCPNCNAELPNEAKFCSFCGQQLILEISCPKCGNKFPQGTVFCMECGTKLTSGQDKSYVISDCIKLTLQTGKSTAFGTNTFGTFSVSPAGISYTATFTLSSKEVNHSYGFSDIKSTEFKMSHGGFQPFFGYTVILKNGTIYNYVYSPIQKTHLKEIDNIIRAQM